MQFATRVAAFRAMIVRDHLHAHGITRFEFDAQGVAYFRKLGASFTCGIAGQSLFCDQLLVATPVKVSQPYPVPGNADSFAARGDTWNARNEQVTVYRDPKHGYRRDSFGEIVDVRAVDGYEPDDFKRVMSAHETRTAAQARVRAHEQAARADLARGRRAVNALRGYVRGF